MAIWASRMGVSRDRREGREQGIDGAGERDRAPWWSGATSESGDRGSGAAFTVSFERASPSPVENRWWREAALRCRDRALVRHEVSILRQRVGAIGRQRGVAPGSKVSMITMRPPQQGHAGAGGLAASGSSPSTSWTCGFGAGTASSCRTCAMFCRRSALANSP